MPPVQCPDCGRFLKASLVEALTDDPTPCPGCGRGLVASLFGTLPGAGAAASPEAAPSEQSVRPPDLEPDTVRDGPEDALQGWDQGEVVDLRRWQDDRPPFPVDAAVVAGAALAGGLLGALIGRRPARDATVGSLVGAVLAAVMRRIWRLEREG